MEFGTNALHAFKWSALGEAASKAIGPIIFIVLARILLPDDFGVVAAATVIISFSQVIWDAGLAKALIQRQGQIDASATVVFWLNVVLGIVVAVLLVAVAPLIAGFFGDERITVVVRVLAFQIPLSAVASVHTALLQKELQFKKLFYIRLLTTVLPGAASIPMAVSGLGYWALIAGVLVGQVTQTTVLWLTNAWRPTFSFDRLLARELLLFGRWVMLSAVIGWFYAWMDAIVVGHYLGSHDMGIYRTGNTLVTMVFGLAFAPMLPVLYSLFSRAQDDVPKLRNALMFVARAIAMVSLPVAVLLFSLQHQIASLIFGPEWTGIAFVIGVLALTHGMTWIVGANGEVYRAVGLPQAETWAMSVTMLPYLIGYLIAIRYGLASFAVARLALAVVGTAIQIWVAFKVLRIPPTDWGKGTFGPLISALAMYAALTAFASDVSSGVVAFAMYSAVGLCVYCLMIALTTKGFIKQLLALSNSGSTT